MTTAALHDFLRNPAQVTGNSAVLGRVAEATVLLVQRAQVGPCGVQGVQNGLEGVPDFLRGTAPDVRPCRGSASGIPIGSPPRRHPS
ncbi:hypothetical protein [Streptomyces sp. F001]|uniref:hypothetical protein n=1 Tax=Streptomyces sp. F001 TaxID=1510026 RepID=UPI00101E3DB1|nr:hypothetical protein [Streptomyces sp. F001]